MRKRKRELVTDAMESLAWMPCAGGIGDDGHTLAELDAIADEGRAAFSDGCYHAAQRAWRILETAMGGAQ